MLTEYGTIKTPIKPVSGRSGVAKAEVLCCIKESTTVLRLCADASLAGEQPGPRLRASSMYSRCGVHMYNRAPRDEFIFTLLRTSQGKVGRILWVLAAVSETSTDC
jgi:hypothetical protein